MYTDHLGNVRHVSRSPLAGSTSIIQVNNYYPFGGLLKEGEHHFATNKHSEFTPAMENIAKKYGLNLDDDWNIAVMPHLGRHPSSYNNWVLNRMRLIDKMPGMNQQRFLEEFDIRIKQPIIDNPEMLRKAWW